jgi:hypothetical protein
MKALKSKRDSEESIAASLHTLQDHGLLMVKVEVAERQGPCGCDWLLASRLGVIAFAISSSQPRVSSITTHQ